LERKLFIHVGPMKTGTTALQNFLRDHDGSLVLYPKTGQFGSGAHHNLVYNFLGDFSNSSTVREDCESLFKRIAAESRRSNAPVIISSELLVLQGSIGKFIETLLGYLDGNFEVEILYAVREYFARAASIYSQTLKDIRYIERSSPDEFIIARAPMIAYEPSLSMLAKTGFKVHVIKYDPSTRFASRFLARLGFPTDRIPEIPVRNRSLSIKGMIVRLAINRAVSTIEQRQEFVPVVQQLRPQFGRSRFIFGHEAATTAEQRFRYDRVLVHRDFGAAVLQRDLATSKNEFWISENDFEKIISTDAEVGAAHDRFRECLREFVRSSSVE
jgi:hypothetical protein